MTPWSICRQVKAALDSEDIEGLLAVGCPADEYDGEASSIESEIAKVTDFGEKPVSVEQAETVVTDVWKRRFGPFTAEDLERRRSQFTAVARRITDHP
jgi:hypothetical protein